MASTSKPDSPERSDGPEVNAQIPSGAAITATSSEAATSALARLDPLAAPGDCCSGKRLQRRRAAVHAAGSG